MIAILATLALLATLLVPMVTPAAASSTYSMSNVSVISANVTNKIIGTLQVDLPAVTTSSFVYMSLPSSPSGYSFNNVAVSVPTNVGGGANGVGTVTISPVNGNLIKIAITAGASGNPGRFILGSSATNPGGTNPGDFTGLSINVPSGVTGEVVATMSAPSSQIFTSGTVTIAKIGTGTVAVAVENTPSLGSGGGQVGIISVKELSAGALVKSTSSLKFTLPSGFTWRHDAAVNNVFWGTNMSDVSFDYGNSDRDLIIKMANDGQGLYFNIKANIDIDESVAKEGDIVVTVGGDSTVSPGTLTVGSYGSYGLTIKAYGDPANLTAGKANVALGKFEIDENLAGSLIPGRTITLTLPSGVVWNSGPAIDTSLSTQDNVAEPTNSTHWKAVGSDGRTIKAEVKMTAGNSATSNKAKLIFKDAKVSTSADFSGDINVTVGGSEGLAGTITLAKVTSGVTASAASTPDVKIGVTGQAAGDFTITETAAGNINSTITTSKLDSTTNYLAQATSTNNRAQIEVYAPAGVTFTSTPTVSVTSGDLMIDTTGVTTNTSSLGEGYLVIPIKSTSLTASTIKISGIKLTIDRTVPEGPIKLKVKGSAVQETKDLPGFASTAASAVVANVVTPAPGEQKAKVIFTISDTKYTVNGVEQTMDVAPYIKDGRTFVPVRYAAQAVGVTPENILYADGKVTLIKGDKVVQLTIGSNVMVINGIGIAMDVPAEIKDGRTMLPFRWVAQALGAKVNWDEATQTVTMEL
ncbi:MAG: copper amine oxidase N-terminal domain-containing protein [Bacillota bacterium]